LHEYVKLLHAVRS